jgi:hypothetical protein
MAANPFRAWRSSHDRGDVAPLLQPRGETEHLRRGAGGDWIAKSRQGGGSTQPKTPQNRPNGRKFILNLYDVYDKFMLK